MTKRTILAWSLMACQMVAWAWLQFNGGQLSDRQYLIFCVGMMLGQVGASIECLGAKAWGTLAVQIYFFLFTVFGAVTRFS